jgi:membrane-associated progesterone receptor component
MTTIMQPEHTNLPPPKDDPFTQEALKEFNGSDTEKPVYVAIKGTPPCSCVPPPCQLH